MPDQTLLSDAIIAGDAAAARSLTETMLAGGFEPMVLVNEAMMPAMAEVGRRFEQGEYFVPELLRSARAMKTLMALLRPLLSAGGTRSLGRVVIGTVAGDVHDIGKHLVSALLEGSGFEVIDLGNSVSADQFLAAVERHKPDIVGMSALLTSTMSGMQMTIEMLLQAGVRRSVKVLVGGAPVTRDFAQEIGADGFSNSATGAVAIARIVLGLPAAEVPGIYLCTP